MGRVIGEKTAWKDVAPGWFREMQALDQAIYFQASSKQPAWLEKLCAGWPFSTLVMTHYGYLGSKLISQLVTIIPP